MAERQISLSGLWLGSYSYPEGLGPTTPFLVMQFECGATMNHGQASGLLDRVWKKEFGDIAFGTAPRKLSDPSPFDE